MDGLRAEIFVLKKTGLPKGGEGGNVENWAAKVGGRATPMPPPTTKKEQGGDMGVNPPAGFGDSLLLFGIPVPTREGMNEEEIKAEMHRVEWEAVVAVTQASGLRVEEVRGCSHLKEGNIQLEKREGEDDAVPRVILKMTFINSRLAFRVFLQKRRISQLEGMMAGVWPQQDLRKPLRDLRKSRIPFYHKLKEMAHGRAKVRFEGEKVYINDTYTMTEGGRSMSSWGEFKEVKNYVTMPVLRANDKEAEQPRDKSMEGEGEEGTAAEGSKQMEGIELVLDADGDVGFILKKQNKGKWHHDKPSAVDKPDVLPSGPTGSATVRLPRDDGRVKVDGSSTVTKDGPVEVPGVVEEVVKGAGPGGEPKTAGGTVQGTALTSVMEGVAEGETELTGGMEGVQ
jgi:hypothetical protein